MTTITCRMLGEFRKDFTAAMEKLSAKYDMDIRLGNIKFTNDSFSTKLEAFAHTEEMTLQALMGLKTTPEMNALVKFMERKGVTPNQLTELYPFFGSVGKAKLIGYLPRRYKYPFTVEATNGKRYKVSAQSVFSIFNIKE